MKHTLSLFLLFICGIGTLSANNEIDSLLSVLDRTIAERSLSIRNKECRILELKTKKKKLKNPEEIYRLNGEIIHQYESFVCDSAESYIQENIGIATQLSNSDFLAESKIQLAFVYSLSGLFVQATDLFKSIKTDRLPTRLKTQYGWSMIRYYENLMKYTDDAKYTALYEQQKEAYRDTVMLTLDENSWDYQKEKAFKLQQTGDYKEAIRILYPIFMQRKPDEHFYAMEAMGLAKAYKLEGNKYAEKKYMIIAAIADSRLAVKENEALLTLATGLYEEGDIDRAYSYVKVALEDAVYYNSRFRNTVIARVHPIIENTYLYKMERQKRALRLYAVLTSLFVIALGITLYFNYRQIRIVSKARRHLKQINEKLIILNHKLDEANIIKEKYISYFMNQCATYVNRLDEYRKTVNRKIKAGQVEALYNLSSRPFEKEIEELYANFDKAFLELYPNFIDEFNLLLKPEERYKLEKGHLNTELRIYALIRLGITDVGQIAIFLHYSIQTIYNYKSRVKKTALPEVGNLEEEVKKLGVFT